ncbi:MAG: ATP-binding protein [Clostridia bacterium]|nr:ATP-binding protein [Clostridia bacterium]
MNECLKFSYLVEGENFDGAGAASEDTKARLKRLGVSKEVIRKVAISMYEAEINMVIHANGGKADVMICPEKITVIMKDTGKGIENIEQAMQEGFSTASEQIRSLGFGAGMGLPNMKKYSDSLDIQSQVGVGTVVTMEYNI